MASFLGFVRAALLCFLVSGALAAPSGGNKGGCNKPRVRREWRQFSDKEQAAWVDAVNCLGKQPHDPRLTASVPVNVSQIQPIDPSSSFYDDLVYMHMDLNVNIHLTGQFLPWHRYYTYYFESQLIEKCGYTGTTPYWDWTIDEADMYNSAFFDNSSHGVGGWGDPNNDYQIYTGGFKDFVRSYPNAHHVRRNFSILPFTNPLAVSPFAADPNAPPPQRDYLANTGMTKANVDFLTSSFEGDFIGFQTYFEGINGTHVGAHVILGGDMTGYCSNNAGPPECMTGPKWTPNDPLFFMHHAMVDKIWWDWQNKHPQNFYSYGGGANTAANNFTLFLQFPTGLPPFLSFDSDLPGDGLWSNVTVWDVIDTTEKLCYVYV